ncbi:hypothetical protein ACFSYG_01850 [Leeuwenhoekiella polynyae]|uniref:Uncharacterized protein n=1 Tax=Leeuwenhoekiella polynyae TaxID=1550906 RepID=A0A4Q0PH36_9FLAO|nr:hypothetical protein [Leeuwenhoekiella polynyae]RXG26322.1 hypothetical protein DSM02_317 [Leeuwenhoekiella polynyae]
MRSLVIIVLLVFSATSIAQELRFKENKTRTLAVQDTIRLDSVSINPIDFEVYTTAGVLVDSSAYTIDYGRSLFSLKRKESRPDSLTFKYRVYPEFLTKIYFEYDPARVVNSEGNLSRVYALTEEDEKPAFKPFDGLTTSGSLVRGITSGNNQNSTLNSELDLQITGKLSEKVSLSASLQDANIPQQNGGYSQRLDEFDQIFIELYSDDWSIRAGDINLENSTSYFGRFTKKVQGLSLGGRLDHANSETDLFATGALVRGVFTQSRFTGQEGNQGPYKLSGPNGELYVLIVSGSERVFVNGVLLERGETADYVIDYNAGELRFNPTFPITSEMRISVEYQYSEQNYTRVIAYAGGGHTTENSKLELRAHVYSESDAKNQPLLQNLNQEQVAVLQQAGDDATQMIAPSANPDAYNENKILYQKVNIQGREAFVFSNDPEAELFNVRFTQVGVNQGDYILANQNAISRIYEYVAPVNGVPQGNYAPVIRLFAPTKLQMAVMQGAYNPSEKTAISFEGAGSKQDLNLFSDLNDANNDGFAGRLQVKQRLLGNSQKQTLDAYGDLDYIQDDFRNIERTYAIEFSRDWNLTLVPQGNQTLVTSGLQYQDTALGFIDYKFEHLSFAENYTGSRNSVSGAFRHKNLRTLFNGSYLKTEADTANTSFFRLNTAAIYGLKKNWIGAKVRAESNESKNPLTEIYDPLSQRFQAYEAFVGRGDSTGVFVEVGYRYRVNDSLRGNNLTRVNHSNTYYFKSQLVKSKNTSLGIFTNYRKLNYENQAIEAEQSLNSRLLYDQKLFKNLIRLNTVFETSSGTLPQQEFTYVKVDEGQGVFTWNDYNGDGVQQLQEFEVAQFSDEADFIRVLLPNQVFVKTHQNKLSQIITLNLQQWSGKTGFKKIASHFYNQTSYLIDRKVLRSGESFDLNPFNDSESTLGLNLNFRNSLFFNRGKQKYTTSYTYLANSTKNLISLGLQTNELRSHQLVFLHKVKASYLINLKADLGSNTSISENFEQRNYDLSLTEISPKLSYLFSDNCRIEAFYAFNTKTNTIGDEEALTRHDLGMGFSFSDASKLSLNAEIKYIKNDFAGSAFSPVAYQILEGLQPGSNFTWNLLAQKRLTQFLDLNLSYFGRKSETTRTIHTGTVQLRAFF